MIFDSHAHYDDEAFDEDRDSLLPEIFKSGVSYIVNAGADIGLSKASVELSKKYEFLYPAVGIHPENADSFDDDSISTLKGLIRDNKKVVAVGEIGLDYYYEGAERDVQKEVFEQQIKLALAEGLPVIVHDREAHGDTFDIIRKYHDKGLRGVLHCYSGSPEMALTYVKLGFYIGFTGVITFKNAKKSLDVLKAVPLDSILIETDCPYLAPVPYRGKRNDSRNLVHVADKACEVLGLQYEYFVNVTCDNAKKLFDIQ